MRQIYNYSEPHPRGLINHIIIQSWICKLTKPESEFLSILTAVTFFIFLSFEDIFCTILSESLSPDRLSSSKCFWLTILKASSILQLVGVIRSEIRSVFRGGSCWIEQSIEGISWLKHNTIQRDILDIIVHICISNYLPIYVLIYIYLCIIDTCLYIFQFIYIYSIYMYIYVLSYL